MPEVLINVARDGSDAPGLEGAVHTAWIGDAVERLGARHGATVTESDLTRVLQGGPAPTATEPRYQTNLQATMIVDAQVDERHKRGDAATREAIEDICVGAAELAVQRHGSRVAGAAVLRREDALTVTVYVAAIEHEGRLHGPAAAQRGGPAEGANVDQAFASEVKYLLAHHDRAAALEVAPPAPAVEAPMQPMAPPERLDAAHDPRRRCVAYLGVDHARKLHETAAARANTFAGFSDQQLAEERDRLGDLAWKDFNRHVAQMHRTLETNLAAAIEQKIPGWEATLRGGLERLKADKGIPDYHGHMKDREDDLVNWLVADNQFKERVDRALEPPGRTADGIGAGID